MKKIFDFVLAAVIGAVAMVATSCSQNEPKQPVYAYVVAPDITMHVNDADGRLDENDPMYIRVMTDLKEIIIGSGEADALVLRMTDTTKFATYFDAYLELVGTKLDAYEQSMKDEGYTLVGCVRIAGGYESDPVHSCVRMKNFGGYIQAGTVLSISPDYDRFVVTGAVGMTGDLYRNGKKVRETPFRFDNYTSYLNVYPYGDGTYTLKIGDKEATLTFTTRKTIVVQEIIVVKGILPIDEQLPFGVD